MESYRSFAIRVAKTAGDTILMPHYGNMQKLTWKLRTNFKTAVDDESDRYIRSEIERAYPTHGIYSEEERDKKTRSPLTWVVDPLDGTLPYTYGYSDHFSVSIALALNNVPIVGVIYAPLRHELYVAEKGKGASLNGKRIRPTTETDINRIMMGIDAGKKNRRDILPIEDRLLDSDGVIELVSFACATLPMCFTASGKLGAYTATGLEPWDMAAGVIINQEGGNTVTTRSGKEWKVGEDSLLIANPRLHKKLQEFLR